MAGPLFARAHGDSNGRSSGNDHQADHRKTHRHTLTALYHTRKALRKSTEALNAAKNADDSDGKAKWEKNIHQCGAVIEYIHGLGKEQLKASRSSTVTALHAKSDEERQLADAVTKQAKGIIKDAEKEIRQKQPRPTNS